MVSLWSREMRLLIFVLGIIIGTALITAKFAPSLIDSFSTELGAGMFGILLGFAIDRVIIEAQKRKLTENILENIYYELQENQELLNKIKGADFKDIFVLFKTTSWEMFNTRLELEPIEIIFELGSIYHRFELFNSAIKSPEPYKGVMKLTELYSGFYNNLERDIDIALKLLE